MPFNPVDPAELAVVVEDVRTYLRDSTGLNTLLSGKVESQDYNIENAIKMALSFYNVMTPISNDTITTMPYGFLINDAVVECLLSAGILHTRNDLQYSSGGVTVNDHSQGAAYQGYAQLLTQLRNVKISEKQYKLQKNIEGCYSGVISELFDGAYGYKIID